MAKINNRWLDWGTRMRAHVKENKELRWAKIAEQVGRQEATVRHWCNGTRDINLKDFFKLCEAANADPAQILFGRFVITDAQRMQLGETVAAILESDPSTGQRYAELIKGIQHDKK